MFSRFRFVVLPVGLGIVGFCGLPVVAHAQTRSLSQLEFDRPVVNENGRPIADSAEPTTRKQPLQVVGKGEGKMITVRPLAAAQPTARGNLIAEPRIAGAQPIDGTLHVMPRLKGPESDESNPATITTAAHWKRRAGDSCKEAANERELCHKADAIQELFSRLTGNNDFVEMSCNESCSRMGYASRVVSIKFQELHGGAFKLVSLGDDCRYQLSRDPNNRWTTLEPTSVVCECVPVTCK